MVVMVSSSARANPALLYRREYGSRLHFRIPAEQLALLRSSFPDNKDLVIR